MTRPRPVLSGSDHRRAVALQPAQPAGGWQRTQFSCTPTWHRWSRLCENVNVSSWRGRRVLAERPASDANAPPGSPGANANRAAATQTVDLAADLARASTRRPCSGLEPHIVLLPEVHHRQHQHRFARGDCRRPSPDSTWATAERLVSVPPAHALQERCSDIQAQLSRHEPAEEPSGCELQLALLRGQRGRLRLSDRVLEQRSLVQRQRQRGHHRSAAASRCQARKLTARIAEAAHAAFLPGCKCRIWLHRTTPASR